MDPISAGVVLAKAGATLLGAKTARPVVTAFLDKVSEATGIITKPWQIRRDARAEADALFIKVEAESKAALIKAEADQQIQTIQERAEARRRAAVEREQQNLDAIVSNATDNIKDDAQPEKMDNDWLANFVDKARLFSDEKMQQLWSQVLAGEANNPGSFSRRSVNTLANLEKSDAQSFRQMCSFYLSINDGSNIIIIDGMGGANEPQSDDFYAKRNFDYTKILSLTEAGLIIFSSEGMSLVGKEFYFSYFGHQLKVEVPHDKDSIYVGQVVFTKSGEELSRICQPDNDKDFLSYIITRWKEYGYAVEELPNTAV